METLTADQYAQVASGTSVLDFPGSLHPKLKELEGILAEYSVFFEEPKEGEPPVSIFPHWCSPKVMILAQTLFERYTPTFQGIVFVEQRHIANCLAVMLPRIPLLNGLIKSDQLVGHGTGGNAKQPQAKGIRGMAVRGQQDTVKMFRERQINIRMASSMVVLDMSLTCLAHLTQW